MPCKASLKLIAVALSKGGVSRWVVLRGSDVAAGKAQGCLQQDLGSAEHLEFQCGCWVLSCTHVLHSPMQALWLRHHEVSDTLLAEIRQETSKVSMPSDRMGKDYIEQSWLMLDSAF